MRGRTVRSRDRARYGRTVGSALSSYVHTYTFVRSGPSPAPFSHNHFHTHTHSLLISLSHVPLHKWIGHSGRILQEDGKIASETLLPVDAHKTAPIRDEDLFTKLMCAMPKGSHLTVIVDGCHGGEVADLPFLFRHKDPAGISRLHSGFEVDAVLGLAIGAAAVGVGTAVAMEAGGCCDDCCSIFFQEVVGVNLGND